MNAKNSGTEGTQEFQTFLNDRNRALIALDEMYVAKTMPACPPEMRLCVLHKARYETITLPAVYRHESGQWLRERNYGRLTGQPLLPSGELPTNSYTTKDRK